MSILALVVAASVVIVGWSAELLKAQYVEQLPGVLEEWRVGSLWLNWNYGALAWAVLDSRVRAVPELASAARVYAVSFALAAVAFAAFLVSVTALG